MKHWIRLVLQHLHDECVLYTKTRNAREKISKNVYIFWDSFKASRSLAHVIICNMLWYADNIHVILWWMNKMILCSCYVVFVWSVDEWIYIYYQIARLPMNIFMHIMILHTCMIHQFTPIYVYSQEAFLFNITSTFLSCEMAFRNVFCQEKSMVVYWQFTHKHVKVTD